MLTVESLGVMGSRQHTGCLHVRLQVPEHAQADLGYVHDICAQGDGRLGILPVGALGAQRLRKSSQVLV